MLPNLAETMSEGEIKLVVDYLATLTGGTQ